MTNQFWDVELHRVDETHGCEFEDGSDTRKSSITFDFVPDTDEDNEEYGNYLVSMFECQDYSYNVSHQEVHKFRWHELKALKKSLDEFEKRHPECFEED